jgi:protein-S-isoprenylcysteine O-methyltransferase Ste14
MIYSRYIFSYLVLVVTFIAGSISLLLFGFFLFGYSFTVKDFGYSGPGILAWDMLLCLIFFFQHSTMIRKAFRNRLTAIVPPHFQGSLYTVASATVLITIVLFWQHSEQTLISLQGISRWVAHGVFFASLIGMIWAMRSLPSFDMLGVQPILTNLSSRHERSIPLTIQGPYRWVRHPLYFSILLMIWCCPDLSVDRLLFNALFTVWIVVGTLLEERDLVTEFGETYLNYQRKVPMLIPWK